MHLVALYPSPPRATAAAGAATLGAAAAAINRGGSTTVTAAATVAREVTSARTRVAVMIDILCDTQAENGAVTWWTAADLDSGYRVQQFWQELEDFKPFRRCPCSTNNRHWWMYMIACPASVLLRSATPSTATTITSRH